MIATINLHFAVDVSPVFHIVPKGYDISASYAVFELRDKNGNELYAESATGITVETITLTVKLKYADGTEVEAGTEVLAFRVSPDLIPLSLGDPDHIDPMQYRYGIRVDDNWVVQGWWTVWPDTGPAGYMGSQIAVCCGPQQIAVTVGSGPKGEQGLIGPAGPWEATSRLVTSSGAILATDTLVFAKAGGADIELSCPDPADLWDGVNGLVITIARTAEDTGSVTITGTADGLPLELFSSAENLGESVYITTTDGIDLIVSDAPFVIQVADSMGGGGYLELEFAAADLVSGGSPISVYMGNIPDGSLVRSAVIRFTEYFDVPVQLSVGPSGSQRNVFAGTEPPDEEGYKTELYRKFSGDILLTPAFASAPTTGVGVIYLTY